MEQATPTPTEQAPTPQSHVPAGFAITSLVTGIVAFLTGWFFIGLAIGIVAIVFGILALKKKQNKGMSIAGIVTGGLGALTSLVVIAFWVFAVALAGVFVASHGDEITAIAEENQSLVDAQKDFAAGETATFAYLDVTVTDVTRDYQPSESYFIEDDEEYIVVNLTIENTSDSEQYISPYDFEILYGDSDASPSFVTAGNALQSETLPAGETATGTLVFEVDRDASDLKLEYTTYSLGNELTYTVAL